MKRRFAEMGLINHLQKSTGGGLLAGLGGCVALLIVLFTSSRLVGTATSGLLVASMGASAVLLFSAPEAPLSQPWNLVGGQTVSALVGVATAQLVPDSWWAASLAVGLAIFAMALLSCTHPPGGATALSAVVGGPGVEALGYGYVLTPVLMNSTIILLVALAFHRPRRTYPHARSSAVNVRAT